jgi:hypothetical protein
MTDEYSAHVTDDNDNHVIMAFEDLWSNMYAEAAREAAMDELDVSGLAPDWLAACATSPICVWCKDLFERVENHTLGVWGPGAPSTVKVGDHCTPGSHASCIHGAPNFKWSHGITGTDSMEYAVLEVTTTNAATNVQTKRYAQQPLSKCVGNVAGGYGSNKNCIHVASLTASDAGRNGQPCPDAKVPCHSTSAATNTPNYTANGYPLPRCDCTNKCTEFMGRCPESKLWRPDGRPLLDATGSETFKGGIGAPGLQRPLGYTLAVNCYAPSFPNQHSDNDLTGCYNVARVTPYQSVGALRGWNDIINNYTRFDKKARRSMPYCEDAIVEYVQNPKYCTANSDTRAAGVVDGYKDLMRMDTYLGNCGDCDSAWSPFSFTLGSDDEVQRKCLNFFVGHMDAECTSNGAATCMQEFQGRSTTPVITRATAAAHVKFMTDKAFDDSSSSQFCGYSDEGCKAKIKFDLEDSMTTIGVLGTIFLLLYLFVILCTMEAIKEMGEFNIADVSNPFKKEEVSESSEEDTSSDED